MLAFFRYLSLSILFLPAVSLAQQVKIDEQELNYEILDINLREKTLYQSAEFFRTSDGKILAPLHLFEALLEINLDYDPNLQRFTGSFSEVEIDITLDALSDKSSVLNYWSDTSLGYYFDVQLLSDLLESKLVVNDNDLTLTITPKQNTLKFPIETRIERESRQVTNLLDNKVQYKFLVEDQYRMLTPPKGQVSLSLAHNEIDTTTNANISLYGDAIYHAANLNLSVNSQQSEVNGRLKFSRDQISPNTKILGLLNNYSFGDVSNTQTRFGVPISGLGVSLSTVDKRFDNYYGKASIDEDVPPNWQVELYKYGYLIGITTSTEDGRVIFEDLDADYGTNRFVLKMYGPYGETETRNVDIVVGNQIIKQGNIDFSANLVDRNKSIFDSNTPDSEFNPTVNIQTNLGLGNKTSVGIGYLSEKLPDSNGLTDESSSTTEQFILSFSKSLSNSLLDISAIFNEDDKYNYNLNLIGSAGRFGRYRLTATSYKTDSTTNNSLGTYFFTRFDQFSVSVSSDIQNRELINQTLNLQRHSLTVARPILGANLSNTLTYSRSDQEDSEAANGELSLSKSFSSLISSRFSLDYLLKSNNQEQTGIQSANFNMNWRTLERLNGAFGIRVFQDDEYQITNQLAWRTKRFNLTSNLTYSSTDEWTVGIGITFNLDYDYYKNNLNLQSEYSARSATLDLFSFEDRNKSGRFDEFDSTLSNVKFGPATYWQDLPTNERGYTYLPSPSVGRPFKITYDTSEAKSDLLSPVYDKVYFFTHAGGVTSFDVPFNYTSFIDGSVVNLSGKFVPSSIPMELVSKSGKVLRQFSSDFNGSYSIENVWPGKYRVRIKPGYLKELGVIALPNEHIINLKADTNFIQLPDFEIVDESKTFVEKTQLESNKFYTIQFGAYDNREYCALRVEQLKALGYDDAFYSLATNECKVFIGEFSTEVKAEDYRKTIPEEVIDDGFTVIYRKGEEVFSIEVPAYSVQLSAVAKKGECDTTLYKNITDKLQGLYLVATDTYCKLYLGDYTSAKNAREAIKSLPENLRKGAFLVKR